MKIEHGFTKPIIGAYLGRAADPAIKFELHSSKQTQLTFIESTVQTDLIRTLSDVLTIGEFNADLSVTLFSGPHMIDLKGVGFQMFRAMEGLLQCEVFFAASNKVKCPKKGDMIHINKLRIELRNETPKLMLTEDGFEIVADIPLVLKPFSELIKLQHLSF